MPGLPAQGPAGRGPAALPAVRHAPGTCGRTPAGAAPAPGPASRRTRPGTCAQCGQVKRHEGLGLCSACWQRRPERPFVPAATWPPGSPDPPGWLDGFVAAPGRPELPRPGACTMITELGRLLADDGQLDHPQALLERARRPGRSMGSLARALEDYFTAHGLALPTDQAERLAAGRRQRRIDAVPGPLRPAVDGFAATCSPPGERARRAGTRPRTDHTIETALATVRDLARVPGRPSGASRTGRWPTCTTSRRSSPPCPRTRNGG